MKRIALILALCLLLSPACVAETSHAEDFVNNLSKTWDSFLGMAADAGQAASEWVEDSGITEWAQGAADDIAAWADDAGLTEWAQGALEDVTAWYGESGIGEWAEGAAAQLRAFIDENGPAVEAWLTQAGEDVKSAWDTLTDPDGHTAQEIKKAYETVVEALGEAGIVQAEPEE